jgi:hypothetical protein
MGQGVWLVVLSMDQQLRINPRDFLDVQAVNVHFMLLLTDVLSWPCGAKCRVYTVLEVL